MITHWTVVGYYDITGEVYVEHITGTDLTPQDAVDEALDAYPLRAEAVVVAVFRGHLDDELGGLGLATGKEN